MEASRIANMVLLGALVAKTKIVEMDVLIEALRAHGKERFFEANKAALQKGAEYVK